ncbi:MAG: TonB-dependent receptor [Thermoanaerobaculia bacterium]
MRRGLKVFLFAMLVGAIALSAFGQATTATIHGKVTNDQGQALANAEVDAVGTQTGIVVTAKSGNDGRFKLNGIKPGPINLVVSAPGFEPKSQTLTVLLGQDLEANFVLSAGGVYTEAITVVGNQAVEMRTAEAATNVSPQQLESLPQDDRNFLRFAELAPGIRMSNNPERKVIAGDAQDPEQTNIFIDGVSFKNDVLQGGAVGQDASRGNPFPQSAVQEFRVITQNYSAQYQKASSAIITAVTKSGGNDIDGEAFVFYQPEAWVSTLEKNFQYASLTSNPDYRRYQPGFSIGGPIIRDQLHYFLSYEADDEHATRQVAIGNPGQYGSQFGQYAGVFDSPFKSNLGFGKVTWQPVPNQIVDFSANYRREHEVRDFGGQTSYQSATDLRNWVYGGTVRHQWNNAESLNQASLSYQKYGWNPTPLNPDMVGLNYEGVIRLGGNSTTQKFDQRRIELRDDYTFPTITAAGDHSIQAGFTTDFMHYRVDKSLFGNPQYNFRVDPNNGLTFEQPYEAQFGFGNPVLSTSNNEYGIYGQDSWTVNDRLNLNLGVRWDYETQMLDQNYVTPANIVAGLTGKIDSNYFSNGSQRSGYKGEIQPRLAFTYDLTGKGQSIIFGGAGRYYDRLFLNATLDERYRLQYPVYRIEFSPNGEPRDGGATIMWDPAYFTRAGLNQLIASGQANPEIYLLNNDTKPPYSNQWNLGFRQSLGSWVGSISYNAVRGYRGFTWLSATGICCSALVPGYGNVIISDPNGKRHWYDGVFLTLDRPYTSSDRWGAHVAWTHAKATQNGNDLFSLDYPSAAAYPRHEVPGSQRDNIVLSGIVGLPWDVRVSTVAQFGTGGAYNVLDFSQGFSLENRLATHPFKNSIRPPKTWGFAERNVDFSLEKAFPVGGGASIGLVAQIFNAFNWANYGCLDNFIPPEGNPNLGNPNCVINLGRREQVGLRVKF